MKTKISTLILVFAIQEMVNGQTQDSRVNIGQTTSLSAQAQKINPSGSKKILADLQPQSSKLQGEKEYEVLAVVPKDNSKNKELTLKPSTLADLLLIAETLESEALKLRQEAKLKNQTERTGILSRAKLLETLALEKQVDASEISGQLSQQQFKRNSITIKILISNYKGQKSELIYSFSLITESEKDMKLAREMREEAYAQHNVASKLGTMGNAEEKELLALNKQNTVMETLSRAQ